MEAVKGRPERDSGQRERREGTDPEASGRALSHSKTFGLHVA